MSVVADLELTPGLDEVRELARDAQPRAAAPHVHRRLRDARVGLPQAARRAGRRSCSSRPSRASASGRWSFLGFRPRTTIRMSLGDHPDPYAAVAEELGALPDRPARGAAAVRGRRGRACSATTSCAARSRASGEPNPDEAGIPDLALMVTDVLVAFDHLRHEVTVLANVLVGDDLESRLRAGGERDRGRQGAAGRPRAADRPRPVRAARVRLEHRLGRVRRGGRARQGVHPRRRRLPGGAEPALDGGLPGRRVLDLPRPARDQPEPVHVLPRLRGLRDRRRLAGVAREGRRAARGAQADRRHAPAHGLRPRAVRRSCSPTRRSAPST